MISCYYSVVRYVPDVVRDEGINIGVVLEAGNNGHKTIKLLFTENYRRAARLDPHFTTRTLEKILSSSARQITQQAVGGKLELSDLIDNYSGGRIQFTEPRITAVDDPNTEIEDLYSQFVYEQKVEREHGKGDSTLKREVKDVFTEHGIDHTYFKYGTYKDPILVQGQRAKYEFDLKLEVNGTLDLFRCISFDVDDYHTKVGAAKVLAYDSRDIREASPQAEIISILQPPVRHTLEPKADAFGEARAILQYEGVRAFNFASNEDRGRLMRMVEKHVH